MPHRNPGARARRGLQSPPVLLAPSGVLCHRLPRMQAAHACWDTHTCTHICTRTCLHTRTRLLVHARTHAHHPTPSPPWSTAGCGAVFPFAGVGTRASRLSWEHDAATGRLDLRAQVQGTGPLQAEAAQGRGQRAWCKRRRGDVKLRILVHKHQAACRDLLLNPLIVLSPCPWEQLMAPVHLAGPQPRYQVVGCFWCTTSQHQTGATCMHAQATTKQWLAAHLSAHKATHPSLAPASTHLPTPASGPHIMPAW